MKSISPKYYSKILLFGEYSLMLGSQALTIPFERFGGRLAFGNLNNETVNKSNANLRKFAGYLKDITLNSSPENEFHLDNFLSDIKNGLYFNSDIPQGYGAGSSGAMVAAVYKAYTEKPVSPDNDQVLPELKRYFGLMESFFHEKSSGLDPLSCYAGRPLRVYSPEKIERVKISSLKSDEDFCVFLADTGINSSTSGLVNSFLEKSNQNPTREILLKRYIPLVDNCIELLLKDNKNGLLEQVHLLSAFQYEFFENMIPESIRSIWENGMTTLNYSLKLCGSGGGGFVLGFCRDFEKIETYFKMNKINAIRLVYAG